ncbi:MAG: ATP-binding protein [Cyclobacteriaceae bacterium]
MLDNPFVESLGPTLDFTSFSNKVYKIPSGFLEPLPTDKYQRKIIVETLATDWFLPEPKHFFFQEDVKRVMTSGYHGRPASKFLEIIKNTREWLENHKNKKWVPVSIFKKPINTVSLFGSPGMGKTYFWDNVMPSCFDQVVMQNNGIQVTFLVLNCSAFNSLKALCLNFFSELDTVLIAYYQSHGVEYKDPYLLEFTKQNYTAEKLLPFVGNISAQVRLGVLVIDEINHLTDGNKEMEGIANFFKNLTRAIGLPIIFSGTPDAIDRLGLNLQSIRRLVGLGMTTWDFYGKTSKDWNRFVTELWKFQVVDNPIPFSEEIKNTFYELTGGVMDLCIKLHIKSQTEAILFGRSVDAAYLKTIRDKFFPSTRKVTTGIISKDPYLISKYKDITNGLNSLPGTKSSEMEYKELTHKLNNMTINSDQASKIIDLLKFQYPELNENKDTKPKKGAKKKNGDGDKPKEDGTVSAANQNAELTPTSGPEETPKSDSPCDSNSKDSKENEVEAKVESQSGESVSNRTASNLISAIATEDPEEAKKILEQNGLAGPLQDLL